MSHEQNARVRFETEGARFINFINIYTSPNPKKSKDKEVQRAATWYMSPMNIDLGHKTIAADTAHMYSYGDPLEMEYGKPPTGFTINFTHGIDDVGYLEYSTETNSVEFVDFQDPSSPDNGIRASLIKAGVLDELAQRFIEKQTKGELERGEFDYELFSPHDFQLPY
jgi:hypothetical protein